MLESAIVMMRVLIFFALLTASVFAQESSLAEKIYNTEKAFEKTVAEKGLNAGFIEYLAPLSVMFVPEAQNGREFWKSVPASTASLTWNPILIDVASNGSIGYSIGNSIRRPKGKADPTEIHGHYISIWGRQGNGEYRALLDTGISHEKPATISTEWRSPSDSGTEKNEGRVSAADSAVGFYEAVDRVDSVKAYKSFLADDAILMREGKQPFIGKKAALSFLEKEKPLIRFAKRKSFTEGPDLAYVYNLYSILESPTLEKEGGNFVQVWKLRKGKWLIVAEALIPIRKQP
jgi:ketosteroid isomerase-like protein